MGITSKITVEWHTRLLPRETEKALNFLAQQAWLKGSKWYLAGGTAMTLQVGHRRSVDLDFFSTEKTFKVNDILDHFSSTDDWQTKIAKDATIYGELLGAKVSFIAYPYFISAVDKHYFGYIPVLDIKDIAVMKIIAVSQRGRKRDFIDLYWYMCNKEPLEDIIPRLKYQYPIVAHNYHHILKSLMYFDDAEEDPMPDLNFKVTWSQVKNYFRKEVPIVAKKLMGL